MEGTGVLPLAGKAFVPGMLLPGESVPGKGLLCGGGLVFGLVPMLGLLGGDPGVELPGIGAG